jgi:hypothetical protein
MPYRRPRQTFSGDVQKLRGEVFIVTARNFVDGSDFYRVQHVSAGGDCVWTSPPLQDIDQANAAADVLAAFVGGQVRR